MPSRLDALPPFFRPFFAFPRIYTGVFPQEKLREKLGVEPEQVRRGWKEQGAGLGVELLLLFLTLLTNTVAIGFWGSCDE